MRCWCMLAVGCWAFSGIGLLLLTGSQAYGQKQIRYAAKILEGRKNPATADTLAGEKYRMLRDSVVFEHQGRLIYCDSARFFSSQQRIEAYSRVHVVDSTNHLYSDFLIYESQSEWARFRYNVRYQEPQRSLWSDSLDYNLRTKQVIYLGNGRLEDPQRILISQQGYYNDTLEASTFIGEVHLQTAKYQLTTDTLYYYLSSDKALMAGTTHLWLGDTTQIQTNKGFIDHLENPALRQYSFDSACYTTPTQTLCADTLRTLNARDSLYSSNFADTLHTSKPAQEALGQVRLLRDSLLVLGHYAYYDSLQAFYQGAPKNDSTYIQPILINMGAQDTLYLVADTLRVLLDSVGQAQYWKAQGHAQAAQATQAMRCDTLLYRSQDSLLFFIGNPMLWHNQTQISSDSMNAFVFDKKIQHMTLYNQALLASVDTMALNNAYFNQTGGRYARAYFTENSLDSIYITGNGESIFFSYQKDSTFLGMNRTISGQVQLYFAQDTLSHVIFVQDPEGKFYPPSFIDSENKQLKYFKWEETLPFSPSLGLIHQNIWLQNRTIPKRWIDLALPPPRLLPIPRLPNSERFD